jgi:hypothetical protein
MTNCTIESSKRIASKLAGFMFLFILIGYILYGIFVLPIFTVTGNVMATVNNIIANEWLFRIGITYELVAAIVSILLSMVLYILFKPINKNLALLALFLKLAEAIVVTIKVLFSLIALQMLNGRANLTLFESEKMQDLVGLFLNACNNGSLISMVFLGMGFTLFNYLFFKSKYIPGILSGLGILSYSLIFIYGFINILAPDYATVLIIKAICWAPSCLFELTIGLWLLLKGIKVKQPVTNEIN